MKSTLIWFLILCSQALSQNAGTFIYVSDYSILYRGYNNHVEFGVTDGSKYRIALEGVELKTDTSFYSNQLGQGAEVIQYYLLPIGTGRQAVITFIDTLSNDTLGVHKFNVANLPNPTLYWGVSKSSNKVNIRSKRFFARYPPEVPITAVFRIESWKMTVNGDSITGKGSNLSSAENFLKKVTEKTTIIIKANVLGPDGITREVKGLWEVKPWKDEKDIKKTMIECPG